MIRLRNHVAALLTLNAGLLFSAAAHAGSWSNSYAFGATLKGDLYTPTTPAASPAILVAIHMCSGHSSTVHGWFDQYADKQGFYIIAPDAGKNCFDSSAKRSGDPAAIVTMVQYLLTNKNADKTRVFAAGMSSGGCMTNTLLAIYPDVFAGGSAMPGFPAGGWPAGDTSCTKCGSSPPSTDGSYWAMQATSAFQWSGQYGCSQQWVGGGDQYNFNGWLPAVVAQWQTLAGLDKGTMATTTWSGWTRTVYKDKSGNIRMETNLGPTSQKHDIETVMPPVYGDVVRFLGLDTATGICSGSVSGGGGMSGTGGASSSGGAPGTGGTMAGGGRSNAGGAPGTGGTGMSAGGAPGTGGTTGTTGGTTGTTGGTGGTVGTTGGTTGTTGGTTGTTGGTGGTSMTTTGGTTGTTGGTTGAGGSTSTAGSANGNKGGSTSTSGAPGTSGTSSEPPPDKGGCSVSIGEQAADGPLAGLIVAGLAFFARRRRARG
ncbi:MAG TPA: PHB depolymerase family esterase [Polyangiaceae bacterium]|nr:PHB depolymerase family esterase [Polyangiaceae bacterium]